jgi:hypothetical protein
MNSENLREIASAQRMMVWGILLWPVGFVPPAVFVTSPFQLYCVYRLAKAIKLDTAVVAVAMLLILAPVICLFAMLWINAKAIRILRANGVEIGLMGAVSPNEGL